MRIRYLLLCVLPLTILIGLCFGREAAGSNVVVRSRIVVVQGTPGDGFVHKTLTLVDDDPDTDGTQRAAPPRAWTIYLTDNSSDPIGEQDPATFSELASEGVVSPAATVIWAATDQDGRWSVMYSRFANGAWYPSRKVPSDAAGELG